MENSAGGLRRHAPSFLYVATAGTRKSAAVLWDGWTDWLKFMAITLKFIADTKKHVKKFTITPSWEAILNMLLIHGLPKKDRKIFDFCRKETRTSREVAQRFGISIYHASTTLEKLHDLTMLSRQEVRSAEGKSFYWKAKF